MTNFLKKMRRELYMTLARPIAKRLSYSDRGDRLAYWHNFFVQHDRWPSKKMLFNDVLYRIKSGREILRPERTFTSDKEFVKIYIGGTVGDAYNVPTLAVLRTEDDIRSYEFPTPCVIKPTHGCGGVTMLAPGDTPDLSTLIDQLSENYYFVARERNYKALRGKLIVEPTLFEGQDVHDYKVFCWKGEARCILYVNDRNRAFFRHMFDRDWNLLPVEMSPFGVDKPVPDRPGVLEEMIEVAENLSAPFDFVRVDFYIDGDKLLVGEITHCHWGANDRFRSVEDETRLSEFIWGTV